MVARCFYPNGNPSEEDDVPCGSGSGVGCCPRGWTCQINGLCYLQSQNYYGRYTCTDKTWNSPGCPDICTSNNTAVGNEAVLECSTGSFCCDGSRPELSGGTACCDASTDRFSIDGNKMMTIMSERPAAASTSQSLGASTTVEPSLTSRPSSSQSGAISVVYITSLVTQGDGKIAMTTAVGSQDSSSTDANADGNSHGRHVGSLVGISIGIIAALVAIGIGAFLLLRRRKRQGRQEPYLSSHKDIDAMYKEEIFKSDSKSELEGSTPDLAAMLINTGRQRQYDSPEEVGRLLVAAHSRGRVRAERGTVLASPLSQEFTREATEPAELPSSKSPPALYELPERSNTKRKPGS